MNKRVTIQRTMVLETVRELCNHPTADEVYSHIVKMHPNISKATVYRNLGLLFEAGEIRRIEMLNGADRYDRQCCEHYHMRCMRCGCVSDADMEFIPDLDKYIRDTQGFVVLGNDIVFKGICPECNVNERIDGNEGFEGH